MALVVQSVRPSRVTLMYGNHIRYLESYCTINRSINQSIALVAELLQGQTVTASLDDDVRV